MQILSRLWMDYRIRIGARPYGWLCLRVSSQNLLAKNDQGVVSCQEFVSKDLYTVSERGHKQNAVVNLHVTKLQSWFHTS